MKNSAMKNTAVALAIALPLLTIGLLVKANESVCLTDAAGATFEQTNETTVTAKSASKTDASFKSGVSMNVDKCVQASSSSVRFLEDLTAQRTWFYGGEKATQEQVKSCICSSNALGSQILTGKFRIQNRGTWFYDS